MAEVQANDKGGGKRGRQKKHTIRVDFTPMVDMNMLLITFFMFATTLLKPQVMNITMPSRDKVQAGQGTEFRKSTAMTILVAGDNKVYYYEGLPEGDQWKDATVLKETTLAEDGIRTVLMKKNAGTYEKVQELKVKRSKGIVSEQFYNDEVVKIQEEANVDLGIAPNVLIKLTDDATYENMVDALDEMLVCNIGYYQVTELTEGDRYLLYLNTKKAEYLTDKQKAELGIK